MAAAALSSSRGVVGVKGLFFIGTLLCLVCFVNSLVKQDQQENLKEGIQKAQQKIDKLKETRAFTSELMSKYMSLIDPMAAFVKQTSSDFPPVVEFMEQLKGYMEKTKAYVDAENEVVDAEIEKSEQELEKMRKFIRLIEDFQAEL